MQITFDPLTVHETVDLCVAVGRYEMVLPAHGGEAQKDSGNYMEVLAPQSGGEWRIVDDIFDSSLPAPGT